MLDWEQDALNDIADALADFPLCTWTSVADSAPADPNKDWIAGAAVTTNHQVRVAVFPPNSRIRSSLQFMAGAEIPEGYVRGLMAGNIGFTPTLKDKFTASNGDTYSLWYMDIYKPAGNVLAYVLGLKP